LDIVEYLEEKGCEVRPAGSGNVRTKCFFHGEEGTNQGRLYINIEDPDKEGLFFCFRCQERGNINKIRQHFGDPAIKTTAVESDNPIYETAAKYYHERLFENPEAYRYLTMERGLTDETIIQARLGCADGGLSNHLLAQGYVPELIKDSGLVNAYGQDYFHDKEIIFPYLKFGRAVQLRGKKIGGITKGLQGVQTMLYGTDSMIGEQTVMLAEGECFPGDAQVLTRDGWVSFEDLGDQEVAQVDESLQTTFVKPIAKIEKEFNGDLVEYSNSQRFYSLTTPKHNMVGWRKVNGKRAWAKRTAEEGFPHNYSTPRIGLIDGPGVPISNTQIRFALAVAADFSIREGVGSRYVHAGFQKERKILAIQEILEELGIPYKTAPYKTKKGIYIHFRLPDSYSDPESPLYVSKLLSWSWISEMSLEQKEFVIREQAFWDGNHVRDRNQLEFSSKHYSEAEWMQAMSSTAGYCSTIMPRSNQFGDWYKVSILLDKQTTNWLSLNKSKKYVPYSGQVYCVTVPSGMILVRQDECVSVSGNCDTLTLHQMGFTAVGLPGVHTWKDEWTEDFEDVKRAYIIFDQDAAGRSGAEKLAGKLGPKARIVELPKKGIDINDWYVKYGKQSEDFEFLFSKAKGGMLITVEMSYDRWLEVEGNDHLAGLRFNIAPLDKAMGYGMLPGQVLTIMSRTGSGKGHPLDTRVVTPNGVRYWGDLKEGDYIYGSQGQPTQITNIYDRGILPTYRVSFTDGTNVLCDGDHIWNVHKDTWKDRFDFRNKTTSEILKEGILTIKHGDRNSYRFNIPLTQPIQFPKKDLKIGPYTMGTLLANGHLSGTSTDFRTPDAEVVERIIKEGHEVNSTKQYENTCQGYRVIGVRDFVRQYKVDVKSADKFIPEDYLFSSVDDRIALLQGLMDGDGTNLGVTQKVAYCTTSHQLALDVIQLVRSLGGTGRYTCLNRVGDNGKAYKDIHVSIMMSENIPPFSTSRKAFVPKIIRKHLPRRAIVSIERVKDQEIRCITVDAKDSLYLIGEEMIVTHNTVWSINMFHRMRMADPNFNVLFVSLEQTRNEWFERAHRIHSFYEPGVTIIDTVNYWKNNLLLIDKNKITEAQLIDSLDQYTYEMGKGPDFTLVDYVGYYARSFKGNSKEQTQDAIMGIKEIAKDFETVVGAPAQANRTGDIGEELTLEMFKDAASIEETSDIVLSLWNPDMRVKQDSNEENAGVVMQRLLKSRNGGVGTLLKYQFAPLTLAMVSHDDPLYDRAVRERSYAMAGDSWKVAVQRHLTNSTEL